VGHPSGTPVDPADRLALRAARDVCRRHGNDFYYASAFLPRGKRDAAHVLFAFCRMTREALGCAGEEASPAVRMRHRPLAVAPSAGVGCCSAHASDERVALFCNRLDEIYAGRLELPAPASRSEPQHVLHAFGQAVRRFQVPRQYFVDVANAIRNEQTVRRYATWASVERHCRRSGGSAALAAGCVLGFTNSGAVEQANKLGVAIRFTQFLRDLKDDVAAGTVYLPLEDMARFRYSERELAAGVVNANFRELMRFEVARARRLFREAAGGLCWVAGDGSRLAAATLVAWSSGLLDAIERHGYDVFSRRLVLTRTQKLRRLSLAWRLARRRPDGRPESGFPAERSDPLAAAAAR
jgi:phytoene synthase